MKRNANPLQYATPEIKAEHEFRLEAVKQNGYAFKHAVPKHKADEERRRGS